MVALKAFRMVPAEVRHTVVPLALGGVGRASTSPFFFWQANAQIVPLQEEPRIYRLEEPLESSLVRIR